jgi:hypothetical protein
MALTTTTVADTLYDIDGGTFSGTILISAMPLPGLTSVATASIAAGRTVKVIVTVGVLSVALAPNDVANPPNSFYLVRFFPDAGPQWTEKWFVPSTTPATLLDVRQNEFGRARVVSFSGTTAVTVPGALFNLGSNIPVVRTFDQSGNEFFGGPITRDPVSKDITVTFMHAHSGTVQLFLTGAQYRKTVSAQTTVSIPYTEHQLKAIAGWCCVDSAGNYKLDGVTIQSTFGGLLQTLVFKFAAPFSGTLVILGA